MRCGEVSCDGVMRCGEVYCDVVMRCGEAYCDGVMRCGEAYCDGVMTTSFGDSELGEGGVCGPTMFPCRPRKARWSSLGSSLPHTSSRRLPDKDKLQK